MVDAMKAAVDDENGGPDVLRCEDVPDPKCAAFGRVVILPKGT
jgi:hypothetical protein